MTQRVFTPLVFLHLERERKKLIDFDISGNSFISTNHKCHIDHHKANIQGFFSQLVQSKRSKNLIPFLPLDRHGCLKEKVFNFP